MSAVGSLKEEHAPGDFVLVDQYIDRTVQRVNSFFAMAVCHVSMAHPVCANLNERVLQAAEQSNVSVHAGGTYVAIEGPQFSSQAESNLYRSWVAMIGMTNMPEAKLKRSRDVLCSLAMVTDYDCWHPDHDAVTVEQVIATLMSNSDKSKSIVVALSQSMTCACVRVRVQRPTRTQKSQPSMRKILSS